MKIRTYLSAVAVILCLTLQPAFAEVLKYSFALDGLSESPPVVTTGTGSALVTIDTTLVTMRVEAAFSDLLGNVTAAHIHCCDFNPTTMNAGVATTTPTFTGFPAGVTSGTYDNTFDMNLASSYRAGFITASGGMIPQAFNALLGGLDSGQAYFNIHSNLYPGGEIRGFADLIPEPTSALLALVGIGAVALMCRRRTI
ncbi:MAG: CHRD domain-containing protein [Pirellulales bacterium]